MTTSTTEGTERPICAAHAFTRMAQLGYTVLVQEILTRFSRFDLAAFSIDIPMMLRILYDTICQRDCQTYAKKARTPRLEKERNCHDDPHTCRQGCKFVKVLSPVKLPERPAHMPQKGPNTLRKILWHPQKQETSNRPQALSAAAHVARQYRRLTGKCISCPTTGYK